jgi:hypothetical protein
MDFFVAVATVSPILLIALAGFYRGRVGHVSTRSSVLLMLFVVAPAYVAMVGSLVALSSEKTGGWMRDVVLLAVFAQVSASLTAIGESMFHSDESV